MVRPCVNSPRAEIPTHLSRCSSLERSRTHCPKPSMLSRTSSTANSSSSCVAFVSTTPCTLTYLSTSQIIQARVLAGRRGARYLSAEDLIFLIRHDRAKVNRLRTYLSWKDVRKHAKDSDNQGGGVEVETLEDGDGQSSLGPSTFLNAEAYHAIQINLPPRPRRSPSNYLGKSRQYIRNC
jgi:hypothetical protein